MNVRENARGMRGPIVAGMQWSQSGHAMLCHEVANDEHAGHHGPPRVMGGQNWKSTEPLSEGFERVLILDSSFQNRENGKD